MSTQLHTQTIIDNLRGLTEDTADLLRSEIRLAQAETEEKMNRLLNGAIMLAIGAALGMVALIWLAYALIGWVAVYFPHAIAALIVGGALAILAAVVAAFGRGMLRANKLAPEHTIDSLRRTGERMKEATR